MIEIIAQRPPANKQGDEIVAPLLTSEEAARERGRQEIDAQCTDRELVSITGPYRGWSNPGALVEFLGRRGSWQGVLRRVSMSISRENDQFTADIRMEIEKEL